MEYYMHGSLRTVAEEISKYKLDLVEIREIRWDRGGTEAAGECMYFYGEGNENHELGTGFFYVHKGIVSAVLKNMRINRPQIILKVVTRCRPSDEK
jgi:hypothetical protein